MACESTQDKAKKLQANAAANAKAQVPLTIPTPDKDIKVLDITVLEDKVNERTAVVVKLKNEGKEAAVSPPILVDMIGPDGKSVGKNDAFGLDASLQHVPLIEPGETIEWVNDQLLPTSPPKTAKITVGPPDTTGPPKNSVPEVLVTDPKVNADPSGTATIGKATNKSKIDQTALSIYVIAHSGNKVVAAGRGVIKDLKAGKSFNYNIFPVGDVNGAQLSVTAFPTTFQ
ncbi:MAG: hypothetical protein H0V25_03425 [Solirubrobacterales bacterium]|nr:hypothetical protein [Solirubrobacterales bacterium]